MRLPCYQPIQMLISQKNNTPSYKVIKAVITNATKHGLFIQTSSKIKKGKVFFSYKDEKSTDTLFFECDVLRTDLNGIAVTYHLQSDSDQEQANCLYKRNLSPVSKGRFFDCYL
jgi:hypothetical protein